MLAKKIALWSGAVLSLVLAVVWPWPPPAVDWQEPVDEAIGRRDCATADSYLEAASYAGVTDAYRKRAKIIEDGHCSFQRAGAEDLRKLADMLERGSTGASKLPALESVGALIDLRLQVWAFFCFPSNDGVRHPDWARLALALRRQNRDPGTGLWGAFHVERRRACLQQTGSLIGALIAMNTDPGNSAAFELMNTALGTDAPCSRYQYALLLLDRRFVPRDMDQDSIELFRERAWMGLEMSAALDHPDSLRLLMRLLHEGRFRPVDNEEAYRMVLRLRRLGEDPGPIAGDVQAALPAEAQSRISRDLGMR